VVKAGRTGMNKELRDLCKAYASGQISWQQYRELRRALINRIVEAETDKTLPMANFIQQ
jgi:hypothetical protein